MSHKWTKVVLEMCIYILVIKAQSGIVKAAIIYKIYEKCDFNKSQCTLC